MNFSRHWTSYLFYAYLGVLLWVPLPLASRPPWAASFFNMLVLLLSIAAVIGIGRTGHVLPPAVQRARWIIYLWFTYCAWLIVQKMAGFSINAFRSQQQLYLTFSYVQLFILTLLLVDTRERLKLLCYVVVGSGLFQALYGGLMAMSGVDKIWWIPKEQHKGLATGSFRNRNQLANYLVMCLSLGCALLIASQKGDSIRSWRELLRRLLAWLLSGSGWLRLLLAALVVGVVLTHSRMGNVSLFVSLSFVGLLWLWRSRVPRLRALLLVGSLLVVDALIVGAWFGLDKVVERLQETRIEQSADWFSGSPDPAAGVTATGTGSAPVMTSADVPAPAAPTIKPWSRYDKDLRDEALPYLVSMAKDSMWTGIGLGNFSTGFTAYNQLLVRWFYNEAHCDYLQFIIEVGVLGTLLLACIVLYCIKEGFMALWQPQSRLLQGVGFAVCMASFASLLHAWVEFNFQSPATASLFVVILALGLVSRSLPGRSQVTGSRDGQASRSERGMA